jgi:hypothetical protein
MAWLAFEAEREVLRRQPLEMPGGFRDFLERALNLPVFQHGGNQLAVQNGRKNRQLAVAFRQQYIRYGLDQRAVFAVERL